MTREEQLWANWFDEHGNGPQLNVIDGNLSATPIHVEWQVTCLHPSACIASPTFGGMYMPTANAREMASRLIEAADRADAEWARMNDAGTPETKRWGHGYVGANLMKATPSVGPARVGPAQEAPQV